MKAAATRKYLRFQLICLLFLLLGTHLLPNERSTQINKSEIRNETPHGDTTKQEITVHARRDRRSGEKNACQYETSKQNNLPAVIKRTIIEEASVAGDTPEPPTFLFRSPKFLHHRVIHTANVRTYVPISSFVELGSRAVRRQSRELHPL